MTSDELARLISELVESRVDRPFVTLEGPLRRTKGGWSFALRRATSPDSYSTFGLEISDGHSEARLRAYLAAVGRHVRTDPRWPFHLGQSTVLDAPIDDDAFDRVLEDIRAQLVIRRAADRPKVVATIDPARRGAVPRLANPELDAAIAEGSLEAHAVYGDWLAQRGDPRGELVAVQIARRARPDDIALAERESELLDVYAYEWFGGLAWAHPGELTITWRDGFIERIVFGKATDEDLGSRNTLLDGLFTLPMLRGLACLRDVEFTGDDHWPGQEFWSVLATTGLPPSVRRLAITATKRFLMKPVDLSPAYHVFAQLEELEIGFLDFDLGSPLSMPELRELVLLRVSRASVPALASSALPKLERLHLGIAYQSEGDPLGLAPGDLSWLLQARAVPALRHLGLGGTVTGELLTTIAASPLVRQLASLDLSEVWFRFDLHTALEAAKRSLAHLELRLPTRSG
jgi:uncharacterized protein (TIGR02996 family)